MIVQADGAVEPCCYWTAHGNENEPLGNVNDDSVDTIWNGEGYRSLRSAMARGDLAAAGCADCFALKQGHAMGFEYDEDCEKPEHRDGPYAANIRLLKREIERRATRLEAKPTVVSVTPSHRCNLACVHCYQTASRGLQWARAEAFQEILALLPTMVRLIAGGGEPLLLPRWRRFVAEFDPRRAPLLNFATTTNATIITPEVLEGLARFKSLHVVVSLDGANRQVFERIRVKGSFSEVEKNIKVLRDAVAARPATSVTTFGLCMSVMKSNLTHLPEFVRWAAEQGLIFSMHPVLKLPLRESLVSFNDPEREMAGWREALDEARHLVRTVSSPVLPEVWRYAQTLTGRQSRQSWPFFQALDDFMPWDIGLIEHHRVRVRLPAESLREARRRWPRQDWVAAIQPAYPQHWKTNTVPYYSPVVDGWIEVSLPAGFHLCYLAKEYDLAEVVEVAGIEVRSSGATLTSTPGQYVHEIARLLGQDKAYRADDRDGDGPEREPIAAAANRLVGDQVEASSPLPEPTG